MPKKIDPYNVDAPRVPQVTRFFRAKKHPCRCGSGIRVVGKVRCDDCVDRQRVYNAASEMGFLFRNDRERFAQKLRQLLLENEDE